ncbi:hypothetical protein EON78_04225, partial [bacterium]
MKKPLRNLLTCLFLTAGSYLINEKHAEAHTKGISLSRYGLVDVSWTGNMAYGYFSDYQNGFNPIKLGERHFAGLNFTSFDLSFTQDAYQFPVKWGLFTAWTPESVGIEEAFVIFHKLPAQLQFKTGIFRVNFAKINQYHDHEWSFADPPLISTLFLGSDGVHNVGAELNWQPPTPFFTEFTLSAMHNAVGNFDMTIPGLVDFVKGGTDYRDFSIYSRGVTYFDISDDSNIEFGISGAVGRNKSNGIDKDTPNPNNISLNSNDLTTLGGLDMTFTYKPAPFAPYVRWTTEFMFANRTNPLVARLDRTQRGAGKTLDDQIARTVLPSDIVGGLYSELDYRFDYNWGAGARLDFVGLPAGNEDTQIRTTADIRYYLNPVSRINLQYAYNIKSGLDNPYHTVFLQLNIGGGTVTPGIGKFYT